MGNVANWVHCKWDRENWNHREQLYEISDSPAAMARAQALSSLYLKGKLLEDEEKLEVRTIPFGEKIN